MCECVRVCVRVCEYVSVLVYSVAGGMDGPSECLPQIMKRDSGIGRR